VERRAEKHQRIAWLHFDCPPFTVRRILACGRAVTARPDPGCAVLPVKGRERPYHFDQAFGGAGAEPPHVPVAVRYLHRLAREDGYTLRQVELDRVAGGGQDVLRCPQDRLVPRKRLGMRRTQQQTPEPQGVVAIEMAGTERRVPE